MYSFREARQDGTTVTSNARTSATAHERLQYVCKALSCTQKGSFPVAFDRALRVKSGEREAWVPDLDAATCFNVLVAEGGQNAENFSLFSMWSFVNVLYWQLRELHNENSVAQNLCEWGAVGSYKPDIFKVERGEPILCVFFVVCCVFCVLCSVF